MFSILKEKYNIREEDKNKCEFYELNEQVEVIVNNKKDFERHFKDGYPVQNLENLLDFKKKLNRPKDQKDIVKIEEYLKDEKQLTL